MADIDVFKKILENHEKRINSLEKIVNSKSHSLTTSDESVIINLIDNGFFDTPKKSSDLIRELKTRAKFNKNTKYTPILKKLTSEEKLIRRQIHHQWVYTKHV